MRIRGQPGRVAQFVPEIIQLIFGQPAFEKGACIDARRSVALEINEIAGLIAVAAVEEMIEAHFEQRGQRRIGRDMAADAVVVFILVRHHRHRVPARQALHAPLERAIAGIRHLFIRRDRVDVIGGGADRYAHSVFTGAFRQLIEKEIDPVGSASSTIWSRASSHSAVSRGRDRPSVR